MKVTMLLADAAQSADGKLNILGGGWSVTGPDPIPSAIALKIDVPWDQANVEHQFRLELLTADGQPAPSPETPVVIEGAIETGRPAGLKKGTPLDAALAFNLPPIPLTHGRRYEWVLSINGKTHDDWKCAFTVRMPQPPR